MEEWTLLRRLPFRGADAIPSPSGDYSRLSVGWPSLRWVLETEIW